MQGKKPPRTSKRPPTNIASVVYICICFYSMQHNFVLPGWCHACSLKKLRVSHFGLVFLEGGWRSVVHKIRLKNKWVHSILIHGSERCTKEHKAGTFPIDALGQYFFSSRNTKLLGSLMSQGSNCPKFWLKV